MLEKHVDLSNRKKTKPVDFRHEEFNPFSVTQNILEQYQQTAKGKGLTIMSKIDQRDLGIFIDLYRYRQIVNDLVSNALMYTDQGSINVALEVHTSEPMVMVLRVQDSGPRIDPDRIDQILGSSAQIEQSTTWCHHGMSQAYVIVRKLVELLDGDLTVHSKVGHGTHFDVSVPIDLVRGA